MAGQGGVPTVGTILLALLLCGLLGVLGQGVRAIVGLKNAGSLNSTTPSEQAEFSLAYLVLSLMIGFIAGILAGIALNLQNIITVDPGNWKLLLGIAGSGYVGADFIENTMSVVIPGTRTRRDKAPPARLPSRGVPPSFRRRRSRARWRERSRRRDENRLPGGERARSGSRLSSPPSKSSTSPTTGAAPPRWASFWSRRARR